MLKFSDRDTALGVCSERGILMLLLHALLVGAHVYTRKYLNESYTRISAGHEQTRCWFRSIQNHFSFSLM